MRLALVSSGPVLLFVVAVAAACGGSTSAPLDSPVSGGASSGGSGGSSGGSPSGGAAAASGGADGATGGSATGGNATGGNATGGATAGLAGELVDFLGDAAFPDDFWQTSTFEDVGMVKEPIEQALAEIEATGIEVHSFLVARRGQLVVEEYGWDTGTNLAVPDEPHQAVPSERHPLFSTTKSILSALIGIALEQGAITDLNETVASYFADYAELNPSTEKDTITLEDLLTMRSGLEWTEGDQTTFEAPDPARAMLSRPVVDEVGVDWNYSSGVSDIVAEILRTATGETPLDFADEVLFGPMGIDSVPWDAGQNGTQYGGWGLSLTPREMARFGELYRNEGQWLGETVVPAAWTDTSTAPRCPTPWGGQYAYHFWVPDMADGSSFFSTLGAFGQLIYVSRELELVVVFTANIPSEVADSTLRALITDYVVPAIVD